MSSTDLNTLASDLRAQATRGSKVVLNESVFADESVRAAIRSAFALSDSDLTISVDAADIPEAPDNGVLTISKAKLSALKQTDLPVRLSFTTPNGGALQATISFEMSSTWKLSESFNGIDVFPFNKLKTSGAQFIYSTVARQAFVWPIGSSTTIDLEPGLN